jgi:Na+/proline symporter
MSIYIIIVALLGAFWIILGWLISKRTKTATHYMVGTRKLGVAMGAGAILAFWITGNTMLAAPESAYTMGYLGAIGYALAGGLGILFFIPLARRIHEVIPRGRTVGDFYSVRLGSKNYWLFFVLLVIYVLGILITQGIGGGIILESIFGIPYHIAVILTFVVVILATFLGGFLSVVALAYIQVMLLLIVTVIVVPGSIFSSGGFAKIFDGILKHSPASMNIIAVTGLLWCAAGPVLGIGEVFMDNTFWQRAFAIDKEKIKKSFGFAGIGWMALPLSVCVLSFIALGANFVPEHVNAVAPMIALQYLGTIGGVLFLIAVWSALTSTAAGIINSISSLIANDVILKIRPEMPERRLLFSLRIIVVILGIIAILVCLPKVLTMLQVLIIMGVVNAAFLFPISFGLLWEKVNRNAAFIAVIAGVIAGYYVYFTVGPFQGIFVSGWASFLITLIGTLIAPQKFEWKQLTELHKEEVV